MDYFYRLYRLVSVFLALACAACSLGWTNDAYVWQRSPAPAALGAALDDTRAFLDGYCFLAAEVSFDQKTGVARIARVPLDFARLAAFSSANGKRVALTVRVGTLSGEREFADFQPALVALAGGILAAARAANLEPGGLQVDFDCPEHKLALYRKWLVALRAVVGKTPLGFTALPCWMDHEEGFVALAREASEFVLQVHSLRRPDDIRDWFSVCPTAEALNYAARADGLAGRAGARFRVALPTYGYSLGFDGEGRFIGLAAEAPRDWPAGTRVRTVRSDPAEMQALALELASKKFSRVSGVLWFRLPMEGDRLAWSAGTLGAVVQNRAIVSQLVAEARRAQPGLVEIVVVNRGQTVEPLPQTLRIAWTRGFRPCADDGLAGYYFYPDTYKEGDAGNTYIATRDLTSAELAPGGARVIGWLRFDFPNHETAEKFSIHASIP